MAEDTRVPVDPEMLAEALRSLGLLYGASRPLSIACAGAASEADAIRAYLEHERPHLLRCYDLGALVTLVQDACAARAGSSPSIEQFSPLE